MLKGFHRTDREMAWSVADDTRITEAGLRVMFIALAMEREPGDEVCLTTSAIQQNSRLKVRAIERGRANLVEFGYLQESPNCRRGNNLYTINCTTLFNDIDDGRNDDSDVSPGKRNDDSDASNDNSDVLNDDSDALNDNSDVSLGEIHYKETETGNYTGKSESFSPSPESASYTPDAPKPEADPKGDDEPTDGQTPTSPSAQPVTEAKPVDELASPPTTPPPPSAKKVAKKPTVKTQREQAAERIVDLYRQKVRSRVLDVATPKAHSVKRICEIMQGGVTEEQLTLAVEKCAVHYADKDPQYRVGIRKFFSKGQGDVWRGLLEMPSSEEKTMSACSLDHLDYWRGEFHEKFGFEWGERFEKRARELQSVEQARDELLPLARSEKELCHA